MSLEREFSLLLLQCFTFVLEVQISLHLPTPALALAIEQAFGSTKRLMRLLFGPAVFIVVIALNIVETDAFYFYLARAQEQCFAYEASRQSHESAISVDVFYSASKCPSCRIQALVQGPSMIKIVTEPLKATGQYDSFTFNANIGGLHRICLTLFDSPGDRIEMEMEIVGANDKREHQRLADGTIARPAVVSKDGYVEQHSKISALVTKCAEESSHLSQRQIEFETTVHSTHWRVVVFTLLNATVVIGVGAWQVLHLRSFFKEKKLV